MTLKECPREKGHFNYCLSLPDLGAWYLCPDMNMCVCIYGEREGASTQGLRMAPGLEAYYVPCYDTAASEL